MIDNQSAASALYGAPPVPENATAVTTGEIKPAAPSPKAEANAPSSNPAAKLYTEQPDARVEPEPLAKRSKETPHDREARQAEDVYGETPAPSVDMPLDPEMLAIRNSAERKLYGIAEATAGIAPEVFHHVVGQSVQVEGQSVKITAEVAGKATEELRAMAADLGVDRSQIGEIRAGFERANSFTDETRQDSRDRAVDLLNKEHGQEAALAYKAACAYVAKNPGLHAILDRGAGDDAKVIAIIAKRALELHKAGKLSLKGTGKK